MQPLKPYFLGHEQPPRAAPRRRCQKCFRTTDIENVGNTTRHLTFFEMLGNFSIGDYFKQGAVEFAWELSTEGFGFEPEDIWVTVFGGDEELGLGPDEEAIARLAGDRRAARADRRARPRGQLLAGRPDRARAARARSSTSTAALEFGAADDLPGGDNERFLEYWNLVFMQYDQEPTATLTPLPAQEHRHGPGPQPHGGDPAGRPRRSSRPTSSSR